MFLVLPSGSHASDALRGSHSPNSVTEFSLKNTGHLIFLNILFCKAVLS